MRIGSRLASAVAAGILTISVAAADAAIIRFGADLDAEAAGATGDGSVLVEYDDVEHTLRVLAQWTGLSGTTTVAHIHCCVAPPGTAGVAVTPGTLPGFPVGVSAGLYESALIDLDLESSFTAAFLAGFGGGTVEGATAALLAGMTNGTAYFNVHTTTFPAGEIRGFLHKVPEPATVSLIAFGLIALAGLRRSRPPRARRA